ncbi:MAG: four helix bundle protein [Candidatus Aminicenantes bacterium]|nr:four helix bundle protein [Candidatus Aminicenantes bacterium]
MNSDQEQRKKPIQHFRDLEVYKRAFSAAMEIFNLTRDFPKEEKYSLVDQIRRSSRSVCANLGECWRKRRYIAVFKNKITDAMQEASETQTWLEFSYACKYLDKPLFDRLDNEYEQLISMLNSMEKNAAKFCYSL